MRPDLRCKSDGATEPEDHIEQVEKKRQERVKAPCFLDRGGNEEEQGQHAEHADKETVIDDAAVAVVPIIDHVTRERHDKDRP